MTNSNMENYETLGEFEVSEVLEHVGQGNKKVVKTFICNGEEYKVKVSSPRLILFKEKGTSCVRCGLEGSVIMLQRAKNGNEETPHFNLWGKNSDNEYVLLTKDHIIPRSRGGENRQSNYQVMCLKCNEEKSNTFDI